jgi:hypothetical protein
VRLASPWSAANESSAHAARNRRPVGNGLQGRCRCFNLPVSINQIFSGKFIDECLSASLGDVLDGYGKQ